MFYEFFFILSKLFLTTLIGKIFDFEHRLFSFLLKYTVDTMGKFF